MRKYVIYLSGLIICGVLGTGFVVFMLVMSPIWFPGITPQEAANILVKDEVFGERALWLAKIYGDQMFEPIRIASKNYSDFNDRNSFWVADLLVSDKSNASLTLSKQLFNDGPNLYARLVGAISLAAKNQYPEPIDDSAFIVKVATNYSPHETGYLAFLDGYGDLAIIALGYTRQTSALRFLNQIITGDHSSYWRDAYACEAVARIGNPSIIPTLRQVFMEPTFYATPEAFDALVTLGDKQAVPLAIARIRREGVQTNMFLIRSLEKRTGQQYGHNYALWAAWWAKQSRGTTKPSSATTAATGKIPAPI